MSAKQQFATALMGVLMLATILMMPERFGGHDESVVRKTGKVSAVAQAPAELAADEVRDFTYN